MFLATSTAIALVNVILESLNVKPKSEHLDSVTVYWEERHLSDLYWNLSKFEQVFHYEPTYQNRR